MTDVVVPFPLGQKQRWPTFTRLIFWYQRNSRSLQTGRSGYVCALVPATTGLGVYQRARGSASGWLRAFQFRYLPRAKPGINRPSIRVQDSPSGPSRAETGGYDAVADRLRQCSGIWQTVWLEPLPAVSTSPVTVTPTRELTYHVFLSSSWPVRPRSRSSKEQRSLQQPL